MDAAYGESVYVDDRTIDSHIKRLRKKFRDVDDSFQQIETLYGVGYRYREAQLGQRRRPAGGGPRGAGPNHVAAAERGRQIGRAHVRTPVTNAHLDALLT